ncbi:MULTISPECIES: hypothetical protein [Pseudobacillus]|uniref:hypothetical protein n=1 Tax=Pseudobacillus TaxID=108525 RepID=UPI00387A7133
MLSDLLKKLTKKPDTDFDRKITLMISIALLIGGLLFFRMIIKLLPWIALGIVVFIFYKLWKKGY